MVNLLDEDEDDIEEESHIANEDNGLDSYNQASNTQVSIFSLTHSLILLSE